MIHRLGKFEVKQDKVEDAIPIIREFVTRVNNEEDDCILYRSLQEKDNNVKFTHYMIFRSKEAEEYHRKTPWVKSFVEKLYPILEIETIFTEMKVIE